MKERKKNMKELLERLKAAEERANKADQAWEQEPESEEKENEFNEARLVGQVLGKYRLGIGDTWIALRIEQFIKDGLLIPITAPEPGTPIYHRILQKTGKT